MALATRPVCALAWLTFVLCAVTVVCVSRGPIDMSGAYADLHDALGNFKKPNTSWSVSYIDVYTPDIVVDPTPTVDPILPAVEVTSTPYTPYNTSTEAESARHTFTEDYDNVDFSDFGPLVLLERTVERCTLVATRSHSPLQRVSQLLGLRGMWPTHRRFLHNGLQDPVLSTLTPKDVDIASEWVRDPSLSFASGPRDLWLPVREGGGRGPRTGGTGGGGRANTTTTTTATPSKGIAVSSTGNATHASTTDETDPSIAGWARIRVGPTFRTQVLGVTHNGGPLHRLRPLVQRPPQQVLDLGISAFSRAAWDAARVLLGEDAVHHVDVRVGEGEVVVHVQGPSTGVGGGGGVGERSGSAATTAVLEPTNPATNDGSHIPLPDVQLASVRTPGLAAVDVEGGPVGGGVGVMAGAVGGVGQGRGQASAGQPPSTQTEAGISWSMKDVDTHVCAPGDVRIVWREWRLPKVGLRFVVRPDKWVETGPAPAPPTPVTASPLKHKKQAPSAKESHLNSTDSTVVDPSTAHGPTTHESSPPAPVLASGDGRWVGVTMWWPESFTNFHHPGSEAYFPGIKQQIQKLQEALNATVGGASASGALWGGWLLQAQSSSQSSSQSQSQSTQSQERSQAQAQVKSSGEVQGRGQGQGHVSLSGPPWLVPSTGGGLSIRVPAVEAWVHVLPDGLPLTHTHTHGHKYSSSSSSSSGRGHAEFTNTMAIPRAVIVFCELFGYASPVYALILLCLALLALQGGLAWMLEVVPQWVVQVVGAVAGMVVRGGSSSGKGKDLKMAAGEDEGSPTSTPVCPTSVTPAAPTPALTPSRLPPGESRGQVNEKQASLVQSSACPGSSGAMPDSANPVVSRKGKGRQACRLQPEGPTDSRTLAAMAPAKGTGPATSTTSKDGARSLTGTASATQTPAVKGGKEE